MSPTNGRRARRIAVFEQQCPIAVNDITRTVDRPCADDRLARDRDIAAFSLGRRHSYTLRLPRTERGRSWKHPTGTIRSEAASRAAMDFLHGLPARPAGASVHVRSADQPGRRAAGGGIDAAEVIETLVRAAEPDSWQPRAAASSASSSAAPHQRASRRTGSPRPGPERRPRPARALRSRHRGGDRRSVAHRVARPSR